MEFKSFAWVDKYRPDTIKKCILPERIKGVLQNFVNGGDIPNLILSGPPGMGKTSAALAMLTEVDADWMKVNSSLKRSMDTIRVDIMDFASSTSFKEGRKFVILDEADGMRRDSQEGLKAFIEEFSTNCGFIITCNHKERILPELHSRFSLIDFKFEQADFSPLANQFLASLENILKIEGVEYDKKVVAMAIKKFYPDFRKTLNELQAYSKGHGKKIDTGFLVAQKASDLSELISLLKEHKWSNMREWVGKNYNSISDLNSFAINLENQIRDKVTVPSQAVFAETYSEYDYKQAFVIDQENNTAAFLTDLMKNLTWK